MVAISAETAGLLYQGFTMITSTHLVLLPRCREGRLLALDWFAG
jgi:hypothetical protein